MSYSPFSSAQRSSALAEALTRPLFDQSYVRSELVDGRDVSVGVAASCVFFIVVFGRDPAATSLVAVDELRSDVEHMVRDARAEVAGSRLPPPTGSGGSSSGPAELPVVEVGVTVRRRDPN